MKKIGIVIAIVRELKSFLESDYKVEEIKEGNYSVYKTIVNGNEVYACKSGYGKIDAAAVTQLLISKFGCTIILNYGVTGALDKSLKVKDLFVVNKTVNYDYDVSPIDPVLKNQYEEFDDIYIPLDKELKEFAIKLDPTLKEATCASGDKFVNEREDKLKMFEELKANICDMEIAGIARICFLNGVKCLSIKCISDEFDGDGKDFNINVVNSANHAFKFIKTLLSNI